MELYVSTRCVQDAADAGAALSALERLGVERAQLGPGRPPGKALAREAERWGGKLLLHHACFEPPGQPHWNLAARDAGVRQRSVAAASEHMRRAAGLGAPFYSLHAGYALGTTLDGHGRPEGIALPAPEALERLARSLDPLSSLADTLGIGLLVKNGRPGTLWHLPREIAWTIDKVAAPPLGLLLDVGHLLLACHARKAEPEPVAAELGAFVRAIALHRNDGRTDRHEAPIEGGVELAIARAALKARPADPTPGPARALILEANGLEPSHLADVQALINAELMS